MGGVDADRATAAGRGLGHEVAGPAGDVEQTGPCRFAGGVEDGGDDPAGDGAEELVVGVGGLLPPGRFEGIERVSLVVQVVVVEVQRR
ncbi:MAG: hypothetical protein ACLGIO_02585 [Acidimicrobiia bacterium]